MARSADELRSRVHGEGLTAATERAYDESKRKRNANGTFGYTDGPRGKYGSKGSKSSSATSKRESGDSFAARAASRAAEKEVEKKAKKEEGKKSSSSGKTGTRRPFDAAKKKQPLTEQEKEKRKQLRAVKRWLEKRDSLKPGQFLTPDGRVITVHPNPNVPTKANKPIKPGGKTGFNKLNKPQSITSNDGVPNQKINNQKDLSLKPENDTPDKKTSEPSDGPTPETYSKLLGNDAAAMLKASKGIEPVGGKNVSDALKKVSDSGSDAKMAVLPYTGNDRKKLRDTIKKKYGTSRIQINPDGSGNFLDSYGILWKF